MPQEQIGLLLRPVNIATTHRVRLSYGRLVSDAALRRKRLCSYRDVSSAGGGALISLYPANRFGARHAAAVTLPLLLHSVNRGE